MDFFHKIKWDISFFYPYTMNVWVCVRLPNGIRWSFELEAIEFLGSILVFCHFVWKQKGNHIFSIIAVNFAQSFHTVLYVEQFCGLCEWVSILFHFKSSTFQWKRYENFELKYFDGQQQKRHLKGKTEKNTQAIKADVAKSKGDKREKRDHKQFSG